MKRRLVTLAAALSLLLCIATMALWVRSYWRQDIVDLERASKEDQDRKQWRLWSLRGGLRFTYDRDRLWYLADAPSFTYDALPTNSRHYPYWFSSGPEQKFKFLGFQLVIADWTDSSGPKHSTAFVAPWPALVSAFGALPTVFAIGRYRRRARKGWCRKCGYDLRATPDRCPECGAVPAAVIADAGTPPHQSH